METTKKYVGKSEQINDVWYPVHVYATSIKEANKQLYVGQRKSYGIVRAVKGRWTIDN
jgi:hypothetical protein